MKTLLLILFFIACWYLASYYLYKREVLKQQKPIFFNTIHLLGGLLLGGVLFVCISSTISLIFRILYILPLQYKSIFIILLLFVVYNLIILTYGILKTTMHVKIAFFDKLYNSRPNGITYIWLLLLIAIPLISMYVIGGDEPVISQWNLPATQYKGNDTIFSQILQEVANTDAHVCTAKSNIQSDIVSQSNRLYKTTVAGITAATVVLGLLILYRTRKDSESK